MRGRKDSYWEIGLSAGLFDYSREWLRQEKIQGDDVSRFSFYGSPGLLWDGGREIQDEAKFDKYIDFVSFLNDMNIGFNVTAQTLFLTSSILKDEKANAFLKKLNESKLNGVIIVKDILKEYVKETYPNLNTISSINKSYMEQGIHASGLWYKRILDNYDYCVINGNDMYDFELLSSLEPKDHLILLVNEICTRDCINRNYHIVLQSMLRFKEFDALSSEMINDHHCPGYDRGLLLPADRLQKYCDIGINHFKIQARGFSVDSFQDALKNYIDKGEL
jgi:hypothetical protein